MKKWFKKFVAVTTATTMMLSLAFTQLPDMAPIFADDGTTANSGNGGSYSITVHPYYYGGTSATAGNGKENQGVPGGAKQENVQRSFKITEVGSDGGDKTDGYTTTALGTTDIRFENLKRGYYKVEPVYTDDAAALNGINSFIVQLPMADSAAEDNDKNSIIKDVHVYPKNYFPIDGDIDGDDGDFKDEDEDPDKPKNEAGDDPNDDDNPKDNNFASSITLEKISSKKGDNDSDIYLTGAKFNLYYCVDGSYKLLDEYTADGTDADIILTDMPYGTYYFVETEAPTGYLKDMKPIKVELSSSDPHVKVQHTNDPKLKVEKAYTKMEDGLYYWTITAGIPSKVENLMSYEVTEVPGDAIASVEFVSVKQGETTFEKDTEYTITDNKKTLKLTAAGLEKLSADTPLTITVSSTIKPDSSGSITNDASIAYKYAYDPDTDDILPNDPNNDADDNDNAINDPDKDGDREIADEYDDTTKEEYDRKFPTEEDRTPGIDGDPSNNGDVPSVAIHEITIVLKDENGNDITNNTAKFDIYAKDSNTIVKSDVDNGSNVKLPLGEYVIKQVTAPDGYVFNEEGVTVTVDENTGSGETAMKVTFTNDKKTTFELPFTGTTATIVFFTLGILIMMTSVFFMIIIIKKKNQDEDKDKNSTV